MSMPGTTMNTDMPVRSFGLPNTWLRLEDTPTIDFEGIDHFDFTREKRNTMAVLRNQGAIFAFQRVSVPKE